MRAREKKDLIKARYKKKEKKSWKTAETWCKNAQVVPKKKEGERCLASHSVESGGDIFCGEEAKKKERETRNDQTDSSDERLTVHVTECCV